MITLFAITGILLLIFIGNQIVQYLRHAVQGKVPVDLLLHVAGLEVPYFVGLLLPIGIFLSVIFTLARLYADNEMVVMFASGLSRRKFISIIMTIVLMAAVASGCLTLWVNPKIAIQRDLLSSGRGADNSVFDIVQPGHFQSLLGGKLILYVDSVGDQHRKVKQFFMAEKPQKQTADSRLTSGWAVVSAKDAKQVTNSDGSRFIVASNGNRYQGIPGQKDYMLVHFKDYGIKIPPVPKSLFSTDVQTRSTASLLLTSRYNPGDMAELQWRFSLPIGALILGLLAIPLGRVNSRQGRYAQFVPAVICCLVYVNMMFVARTWLERGILNPWIGIWSVHVVALLLVLVWMWWRARRGIV